LRRLTREQSEYRNNAAAWTIAEVVDHIARVDGAILHAARKPGVKRTGWKPKRQVRLILWLIFRFGIRIKVPGPVQHVQPEPGARLDDSIRHWTEARLGWREFLGTLTPEQLNHMANRHPVAGPFAYREVLTFVERHQDHHSRQIERIRRAPGFPRNT
jgi:uncharacterized damage-inducible protein DinB